MAKCFDRCVEEFSQVGRAEDPLAFDQGIMVGADIEQTDRQLLQIAGGGQQMAIEFGLGPMDGLAVGGQTARRTTVAFNLVEADLAGWFQDQVAPAIDLKDQLGLFDRL